MTRSRAGGEPRAARYRGAVAVSGSVHRAALRDTAEGRVRDRVAPGKVSAYATLALRRQLERDGLDDLVGELVEVNGPLDAEAVARYVDEWR